MCTQTGLLVGPHGNLTENPHGKDQRQWKTNDQHQTNICIHDDLPCKKIMLEL